MRTFLDPLDAVIPQVPFSILGPGSPPGPGRVCLGDVWGYSIGIDGRDIDLDAGRAGQMFSQKENSPNTKRSLEERLLDMGRGGGDPPPALRLSRAP